MTMFDQSINELYHYGIKGMKWGIRRYQNEDGTLTEEGKKRYGVKGVEDVASITLAISPFILQFGLAIFDQVQRTKTFLKKFKNDKKFNEEYKSKVKKIQGKHTVQDDMKAVNPNYKKSYGYKVNCGYCSTAFELRRRGYDVEALKSKSYYGTDMDSWLDAWNNPKTVEAKDQDKGDTISNVLQQSIKKFGKNQRGEMAVYHELMDCRHSVAYEVTNGKLHIYDSQKGSEFTDAEKKQWRALNMVNLINQEPNYKMIAQMVKEK